MSLPKKSDIELLAEDEIDRRRIRRVFDWNIERKIFPFRVTAVLNNRIRSLLYEVAEEYGFHVRADNISSCGYIVSSSEEDNRQVVFWPTYNGHRGV